VSIVIVNEQCGNVVVCLEYKYDSLSIGDAV
jgi:hypothetical protein